MALQSAVGTALGVSATLPTTFDSSGYGALSFTSVGRLQSAPDLDGTYDVATFDDLTTGEELKFADMLRAGESTFEVGLASTDAGQVILEANKGKKVAIKVTLKGGAIYYRTGIIQSYRPTGITVGNVVMAEVAMAFEGSPVKVAGS